MNSKFHYFQQTNMGAYKRTFSAAHHFFSAAVIDEKCYDQHKVPLIDSGALFFRLLQSTRSVLPLHTHTHTHTHTHAHQRKERKSCLILWLQRGQNIRPWESTTRGDPLSWIAASWITALCSAQPQLMKCGSWRLPRKVEFTLPKSRGKGTIIPSQKILQQKCAKH